MTLQNWLICFLAASLVLVASLALVLQYLNQARLMKIFSERQGVPISILEGKPEEKAEASPPVARRRISVPLPGAENFRKPA
jgi:cell division protein FtsN